MSDGDLTPTVEVDARGLQSALRKAIRGEVRFDAGSRALYASDSSNYRQVPIGVVIPRDRDDVLATLELCRRFGAPILGRGAGTSLAGQCCNVAVVIDTSKHLDRIVELDPAARSARVEPGVILDRLRDAAEAHGLTFGPDPATHAYCTLGGMIGNNSCGVHSLMAGKTDDNVLELEVVAGDGTLLTVGHTGEDELARITTAAGRRGSLYARLRDLRDLYAPLIRSRYPPIPRRVSGYNLPHLLPENGFDVAKSLVGSEGTCAFVLEAKVRLVPSPPARVLVVLGFSDVYAAADAVPEVLGHGPIGLEGFDDRLLSDMESAGLFPENRKLLPEGRGWLLAEVGAADPREALAAARRLAGSLSPGTGRGAVSARIFDRREEAARVWQVRQAALGATAHVPGRPQTWEGWEDAAVAPEKLGAYLRDWRALLDRYGYGGDFYGHFGQGCVHTRTDFDFGSADGVAKFRAYLDQAADLVVSYGGSISGEHGDGQARAELLPKMFGAELIEAFRQFKAIWDPDGLMNPGKLVDPYRADENLRHSGKRAHPAPRPAFAYANDAGDFARALQRCVGVGECRRLEGGVMCPSFLVTREEKHTTRGRARLMDEALRGDVLAGGWKEDAVRESLDLCLACKGCKSDCPVGVDVATWKAEFLSRYYRGRLRPRSAYAMGLVHRWARAAAVAPRLANFVSQTPALAGVVKTLAGIAPERRLPRFAPTPFREQFRRRDGRDGRRVLLFPDTFTNFFRPEVATAAVDVLESAGFAPVVPPAPLCCGRPLYDFGMLGTARRLLAGLLDALDPEIAAGTPVVVLEPSCAAVFRDELPGLFSRDERAARLARNTHLLAGFLEREAPDFNLRAPATRARALVQFHCHQRALFGIDDDRRLLSRAGVEFEVPDSGCCGMAGAFGFEASHYEISMAIGERVILPAVRAAAEDTVVLADGFSCREQIFQATGRRPLHLAELMRSGITQKSD